MPRLGAHSGKHAHHRDHGHVSASLRADRPGGNAARRNLPPGTEEEEIPYGQNIEPAERITHLLDGTRPPTIWR
jgi:hypothetical protein